MQLVITEVSQIQPYIFGSNRMRENVGASCLVAQATERWALEIVGEVTPRNNINPKDREKLEDNKCIGDPKAGLDAEVLYAGGGNFVVLFRDEDFARRFIRKLSRKVLTDAPGLQLVAVRESFEWGESLSQKVKIALETLEEKKRAWVPSAPLLGLGVTVMCRSTGLPAVGVIPPIDDEPGYPASAEVFAKLQNVDAARKRLEDIIPPLDGYKYPKDLDYLGRSRGEYSHIAVVHIDGNDMGQRKKDIGREYENPEQNRAYIKAMRAFSDGVKEAAQQAQKSVNDKLVKRLKQNRGNRIVLYSKDNEGRIVKEITKIELKPAGNEKWYLPILPIVYGGDDVTFICDGRLGLSLAIAYMRAFEEETGRRPECRGKVTSCAGIAIVKSHYPFAQAYKLAEDLCKSAKNYRRKNGIDGSCLDWHFALSGFSGTIEEIREREYKVREGWLTLRPVTLDENPLQTHRSWAVVKNGIEGFREKEWIGRRNKIKALREALRSGSEAVEQFRLRFETKPLPEVDASMTDRPEKGWHGGYCGYFDAIELVDWFIPLEEEGR
ncbi:MAG: hypothetical protein AB1330_09470 [Bacillota bacterium]